MRKKSVMKSMKRKEEQNKIKFTKLTSKIIQSGEFLDVIDKQLRLHDEAEHNKTRRQYEDWQENVHGKIQGNITNQLNSMDYKTLHKLKNDDYEKFLNVTNRKAAIFRDIIIESEYDPLEPNRRAIKANAGYLKDPTMIVQQKTISEASMLDPEIARKMRHAPCGKETLNVELWAAGKIDATPHGSFARMMEEPSTKTNTKMKSNVVFDHYNYPIGKEANDAEMPIGKRPCGNVNLKSNPIFNHAS
jgi:hypothetical protein